MFKIFGCQILKSLIWTIHSSYISVWHARLFYCHKYQWYFQSALFTLTVQYFSLIWIPFNFFVFSFLTDLHCSHLSYPVSDIHITFFLKQFILYTRDRCLNFEECTLYELFEKMCVIWMKILATNIIARFDYFVT